MASRSADAMLWRAMTASDLTAVKEAADRIHPSYPEAFAIFAERHHLYAAGCFVLADDGGVAGYLISHPWRYGEPPALNALLGRLPEPADTYYLHDIALSPRATGHGHAILAVERAKAQATATGLSNMTLVAVNQSAAFWRQRGFAEAAPPGIETKLASYGDDARFMELRLA